MKRECSTFYVFIWINFERSEPHANRPLRMWKQRNDDATCELMHKHLFPVCVWTSHPVSRSPEMRVCVPRVVHENAENRISNLKNDRVSASASTHARTDDSVDANVKWGLCKLHFQGEIHFEIAYGQGQRRKRNPKRLSVARFYRWAEAI